MASKSSTTLALFPLLLLFAIVASCRRIELAEAMEEEVFAGEAATIELVTSKLRPPACYRMRCNNNGDCRSHGCSVISHYCHR
ncbi:hypothetical protein A4A49_17933 [Nicotiana attenuata]|uniref:Uncharacterized protein n=1 Tax=Nicotiana attenuata TaxID=49451 RepID=A0A314KPT1_NICAT|nr:hypothetical protein A4A49_17933 [Nicotiana attenuata]